MFEAVRTPYLVPYNDSFRIERATTSPPANAPDSGDAKDQLRSLVRDDLDDLQRKLYAGDRFAVLCVFQAMDAAGKDSTIRSVFTGVNPAGFQVFSFKQPSALELDHDFLWRTAVRLPERGRIGVFNRSYYEEVLVVRVHPEYLRAQRLPDASFGERFWHQRYQSIRTHEKHLAGNGTLVLKFFLNVSKAEQKERFLSRIERPHKNWKFSSGDVDERAHWDAYMSAYEDALNATSRPWAPWYAIPADDKPFMRLEVARTIVANLQRLGLAYPRPTEKQLASLEESRIRLQAGE